MQVGTTEDQGLYSKPSVVVHPGALAAGTLPQYNTIQYPLYVFPHLKVHKKNQFSIPTGFTNSGIRK